MTWEAYKRAKADPEWQEVHARYLSRKADKETSAQQAYLDRMFDIEELFQIEKKYEEENQ